MESGRGGLLRSPSMVQRTTGTRLRILSATYGPAEGRRLLNGKLVNYNSKETHVPYTRDVLPFLRALAALSGEEEGEEFGGGGDLGGDGLLDGLGDGIISGLLGEVAQDAGACAQDIVQGRRSFGKTKNAFALMDGRPMNAVFGDPCPGTTKLLRVEYLFQDFTFIADESPDGSGRRIRQIHCTTSRVFKSTFREHERVLLKRQDPLFRLLTDDITGGDDVRSDAMEGQPLDSLREVKPSAGLCGHDMGVDDAPEMVRATPQSSSSSLSHIPQLQPSSSSSPSRRWKLAPSTSEITLPIILPFLTVRQRAQCQLVCSSWRDIVLERGVAVVVDVNDVGLFPKDQMDFAPKVISRPTSRTSLRISDFVGNNSLAPSPSTAQNHPSRVILRGLVNHSYSSLESLVLNDYLPLQPDADLHPALPHLRKLRRLDISRIPSIRDETLHLISTCVGERLEVLYMKGLKNVTNDGVIEVVRSCRNLRVLDVSNISQLDDEAGIAISGLVKLEVLNTKDNYKWTNRSVDLITRNCKQLFQASLWGIIRLKNVTFDDADAAENDTTTNETVVGLPLGTANSNPSMRRPMSMTSLHDPPPRLVLLNLWGCHGLTDDAAARLSTLTNLRSLCVSECHKLTDLFVEGITQSLPQLVYLCLRYVRRITDASLEAIGHRMTGLYSLDVSFCNKLTAGGLAQLMAERCTSLAELRLYTCRQLNVEGGFLDDGGNANGVAGGRQFVQALRNVREVSNLSFLDLRECQVHDPFVRDDVFLNGMAELGFIEQLRGLFVRPARWNADVKRQLTLQLSDAEV